MQKANEFYSHLQELNLLDEINSVSIHINKFQTEFCIFSEFSIDRKKLLEKIFNFNHDSLLKDCICGSFKFNDTIVKSFLQLK